MKKLTPARKAALVTAIVLVASLAVRGLYALTKHEWHVDEGITLMLTNGNWMPGLDMADHDEWLTGADVRSKVFSSRINRMPAPEFGNIAEATAADVHPPLYYWLFAVARKILPDYDGIPAGYALNAILFAISCVLLAGVVWRVLPDPAVLAFTLLIFGFSSATASLTVFLRMYELLQTLCVAFLASSCAVLFPARGKAAGEGLGGSGRGGRLGVWLGVVGLFATTFLGLMTHYYFAFFALPVCLFALVWLIVDRRPADLLWSILAVAVAAYCADRFFPPMREHLTKSYRATQSVQNLSRGLSQNWLGGLVAYVRIVSGNLVPLSGAFALAILAIVNRARRDSPLGSAIEDEGERAGRKRLTPAAALFLAVFAVTFAVIAVSSPYRTVRYVASFFSAYALAFVMLSARLLPLRQARFLLGAIAIVVAVHGSIPSNRRDFHEDYQTGETSFLRDGVPLIVMGSMEGTWKVPLVYVNIPADKRIYSTRAALDADVTGRLRAIARLSGEEEAYALVCDYIGTKPNFERVGYFGFYDVYRVTTR